MQNYEFDFNEYKKRIKPNSGGVPMAVLIFVCLILIGVAFFLKPAVQKYNSFYFVEVNNFLTLSDAQTLCNEIQSKGGAGYIYFDGKYHVLANFYASEQDAKSVCENLMTDYNTAQIFKIEIKKNINLKNLNSEQKTCVENLYECGYSTINQLYSNIIAFDKAEITATQLNISFNALANEFLDVSNAFNSSFAASTKFDKAKTYIEKLNACLNNLKTATQQENCKQKMKFEMISFVINFSNAMASF